MCILVSREYKLSKKLSVWRNKMHFKAVTKNVKPQYENGR